MAKEELIYKIVVWGMGDGFKRIQYVLRQEEEKGIINVQAITAGEIRTSYASYEGIPIVKHQDALKIEFDYIVIAVQSLENERAIMKELVENYKIDEEKIIKGRALQYSYFDFKRYIEVKEKKVSIMSNNCSGGFIYNTLGLKFQSPFINTQIEPNDWLKFLENPERYLMQEPVLVKEKQQEEYLKELPPSIGTELLVGCPIIQLGDMNIYGVHDEDESEFLEKFIYRKKRINKEQMLFLTQIETNKIMERFIKIKGINKYGFYCGEKDKDVNDQARKAYFNKHRVYELKDYWNFKAQVCYSMARYFLQLSMEILGPTPIDWLRLLNGEPDFIRYY